jgi:hypothetical protein
MSSTGKVAGVNPKIFKIIEGKLYLSWTADSADKFEANASENIRKADAHWKNLTQKQ